MMPFRLTPRHLLCSAGASGRHCRAHEIAGKNYNYLRPGIETTFYEARCVQVIDAFGNRIRFNEDLKPGRGE
jgi:hypothetical protein